MARGLCIPLALALAGCQGDLGWPGKAPRVGAFSVGEPDVVLLVTGSNHGRLEVCDCPGPMTGGLSRRSGLVKSYRRTFANVFLADVGNALWVEPDNLANRYVFAAYRAIGYDAVALGDHEWAGLPEPLEGYLRSAPLNYLATNASDTAGRVPLSAVVKKPVGPETLAVISYLGPRTLRFLPPRAHQGLSLRGAEHVRGLAQTLKAEGCAVVVLAHVAEEELADLAAPECVDLIVRGNTTRSEPGVLRIGEVPTIKVGGPEHVAAVALRICGGRIAALDYRLEVVDDRWPSDRRLEALFREFSRQARRQARDARAGATARSATPAGP